MSTESTDNLGYKPWLPGDLHSPTILHSQRKTLWKKPRGGLRRGSHPFVWFQNGCFKILKGTAAELQGRFE
ncbi:hypothetical protein MHYP_G00156560 [Metynnis hypsauchen]